MARTNLKRAAGSSFLAPERLYSIHGFARATGISCERIQQMRKEGVTFPAIKAGRRIFILGSNAIEYVTRVAELTAKKRAASVAEKTAKVAVSK